MRARGRYLGGLLLAALAAVVVVLAVPGDIRPEIAWATAIGLLIQAPLGWVTVRSLGTERFQLVWGLGMVLRLAAVALAGLILVPGLRWEMGPTLGALVATMLALLVVEVVTVVGKSSEIEAR